MIINEKEGMFGSFKIIRRFIKKSSSQNYILSSLALVFKKSCKFHCIFSPSFNSKSLTFHFKLTESHR